MNVGKPEILQRDGDAVYRVRVDWAQGTTELAYRLPDTFRDFLTDLSDAPVVALLIPAMASGEDMHVHGDLSERLWFQLSGPYQRLLQQVIPSLRRVRILPAGVRTGMQRAPGVATGFSAGIDSFCVLADHHYAAPPAGFRLTHLLFNNVGSHGTGPAAGRLFRDRHARLAPVAERIGLPLIRVDSNVDAFYGTGLGFQQTHTPRNASVPLLLQGGIGRFLYASTYADADAFVGPSIDMAFSDPMALPMLCTEALDALSVGGEYTRVAKTLRVAEIPDSLGALDVCAGGQRAGNCSTCVKCMRTLLTLEIAGVSERYARSFDLEAYRRRRGTFVAHLLTGSQPLQREIIQFARERGFTFPFRARGRAHVRRAGRLLRWLAGRLAPSRRHRT